MGYEKANGQWANTLALTLAASAARTTSTAATSIDVADRGVLCLTLDVASRSGTNPTLDVTIQTSADNSTWRTLGTFAQKTAAGSERKSFAGCDRYVRASWAIGGTSTPTFTFSVAGEGK